MPGSDTQEDEQIQPTFLFNVLNRLYRLGEKEKIDPAGSIKKINDLILYAGYDAKKTMLPLERELEALKEYIELEKMSFNYSVDVEYQLKGNTAGKMIIPFVLIPIVEHSFSCLPDRTIAKPWLKIQIDLESGNLYVRISSSKSFDTSTLLGNKNLNVLNIEKRLQLRYPGGYLLKKTIEPEILFIELRIDLSTRLGI